MSSRIFLLFTLLFLARNSWAIQIKALYSAACERELGVIIDVSPRDITLLSLDGTVKSIPRYQVIYLASYSLNYVPIESIQNLDKLSSYYQIETWQDGRFVELVSGWPIGFSRDRIAFLTTRGGEVIIPRRRMWRMTRLKLTSNRFSNAPKNSKLQFAHPQIFSFCSKDSSAQALYSDSLLSDPIDIKHALDDIQIGQKKIADNYKDQQFYPLPEIYTNKTSLGLWLSTASRYGASESRSNNFTPVLTDDYSSGVFDYQRHFVTGAAPLEDGVHEEPQTQVYYGFKAAYFHLAAMFDPSTILVGSAYNWDRADMNAIDSRTVEKASFRSGFDYGRWAFDLVGFSSQHVGTRNGNDISEETFDVGKIGLSYQAPDWKLSLLGGSGSSEVSNMSWFRVNFDMTWSEKLRGQASYISRKLDYDGYANVIYTGEPDPFPNYTLSTKSSTGALYVYYQVRERHELGGYIAIESVDSSITRPSADSSKDIYPKAGVMTSLSF